MHLNSTPFTLIHLNKMCLTLSLALICFSSIFPLSAHSLLSNAWIRRKWVRKHGKSAKDKEKLWYLRTIGQDYFKIIIVDLSSGSKVWICSEFYSESLVAVKVYCCFVCWLYDILRSDLSSPPSSPFIPIGSIMTCWCGSRLPLLFPWPRAPTRAAVPTTSSSCASRPSNWASFSALMEKI